MYERLDISEAKSLDLEQQKRALTKKVNQLAEEVIDPRKANLNLSIDLELRFKEYDLLFHGLKSEGPEETASLTATLVTKFLNENLAMDREFVNKIKIAHAHRLPKKSAGSNAKVLDLNSDISSSPIVNKFVKMKDKQTILYKAVDDRKSNIGITQHLPLAMQLQRRDLLGIAKTFRREGKMIKWRIIGSDYCFFY